MSRVSRCAAASATFGAMMLAVPALSSAAGNSIHGADGVVTVNADVGKTDFVAVVQENATNVFVYTAGSTYSSVSGTCAFVTTVFFGAFRQHRCTGSPTRVIVNTDDLDDRIQGGAGGNFSLEANGGAGNDTLSGGSLIDLLSGDVGNDTISGELGDDLLNGGEGTDQLNGGDGKDALIGGSDRDTLNGGLGADDMDGGPGFDTADYSERTAGQPVDVSLDGAANDGNAAQDGELDNVRTGVEDIRGGEGGDNLTGNDQANELFGAGGLDLIDGRAGTDRFSGGAGDDTILARDGNPERVDCGENADEATTDTVDEAADCETVKAASTIEADKDSDGFKTPADCNDTDASVRPGARDVPNDAIDQDCDGADAKLLDADGDGFNKDVDCDDSNPNAKPGGIEIVGNEVDENCDFFAPPTPVVETPVRLFFLHSRGITTVTGASVGELEAGTTVVVTCKGRKGTGCPKKSVIRKTVKKKTKQFSFFKTYRSVRLRKGATITVQITKPGFVGRFVVFKIKPKASPTPNALCINPGEKKAKAC